MKQGYINTNKDKEVELTPETRTGLLYQQSFWVILGNLKEYSRFIIEDT